MINIFTNIDLFRYIDKYIDLRSLCDTCSQEHLIEYI